MVFNLKSNSPLEDHHIWKLWLMRGLLIDLDISMNWVMSSKIVGWPFGIKSLASLKMTSLLARCLPDPNLDRRRDPIPIYLLKIMYILRRS